jgi:hypothetical protein
MARRSPNIHERFLRHIWSNQYLKSAELTTTGSKPVRVLSVGTLNLEGGPDFRNAKIKVGETTLTGDVEIHRTAFDWFQHRHQEDPRYNSVILHVVLEPPSDGLKTIVESGRAIPTLVLGSFLSEPVREIWRRAILDERAQTPETIPCYKKNSAVSSDLLRSWLNKLSVERVELKLRRFEDRLRELALVRKLAPPKGEPSRAGVQETPRTWGEPPEEGETDEIPPPSIELSARDLSKKELWEQVMYEGVMEGLGYSKNREPFVRLARNLSLEAVRTSGVGVQRETLEALLFGVAGLLPKISSLKEKESREYVRPLNKQWKSIRPLLNIELLNAADWQFFPTRPTNFPTLRMAAAAQILFTTLTQDLFRSIVQTFKKDSSPAEKLEQLRELFSLEPHEFWQHHYQFDKRTATPVTPLGSTRLNEILLNAVVPVSLLYARVFRDSAVRSGVLALYRSFKPSQENSITRLMEKQLFIEKLTLNSAASQQGAIQLYKFYCTEKRCSECEVGRVVFGDRNHKG